MIMASVATSSVDALNLFTCIILFLQMVLLSGGVEIMDLS